ADTLQSLALSSALGPGPRIANLSDSEDSPALGIFATRRSQCRGRIAPACFLPEAQGQPCRRGRGAASGTDYGSGGIDSAFSWLAPSHARSTGTAAYLCRLHTASLAAMEYLLAGRRPRDRL